MSEIGIDNVQDTSTGTSTLTSTSTSTSTIQQQQHPIATSTVTNSSTTTPSVSVHDVHECNWEGSIPIVLSLSETSIGSPMIPPSIHVMVARNTYLHIGLQYAIVHVLAQYAYITASTSTTCTTTGILQVSEEPDETDDGDATTSRSSSEAAIHQHQENQPQNDTDDDTSTTGSNASYPICWFEDETTKVPLRWQYFVGVLYDMIHTSSSSSTTTTMILPWKITVHFNHYPSAQYILPMEYPHDVVYTVQNIYKHTIKQSMTIIHGNSKFAMYNISKEIHELLWNAICTNNYTVFRKVNVKLLYTTHHDSNNNNNNSDDVVDGRDSNTDTNNRPTIQVPQQQPIPIVTAIPIRVMLVQTTMTTTTTTTNNTTDHPNNIASSVIIPPMIQKRVDYHTYHSLSLGQLLHDWLPDHFVIRTNQDDDDAATTATSKKDSSTNIHPTVVVVPNRNKVICWKINGIFEPSLQLLSSSSSSSLSQSEQSESQQQQHSSMNNNNNHHHHHHHVNNDNNIYNLWKYCHQPDYFLYIIVITI